GGGPGGGGALFRLYDTPDAAAAQAQLARHHIWSRIFPYSARWLRLGLPGSPAEWDRLAAAVEGL
ncbi:MAG: threonine-phosphate decarboxylase, partial [Rhodobacteraceae bacterium]|nr:threonine-phosphate decarboxylase [Paracoccaceae bacterium]